MQFQSKMGIAFESTASGPIQNNGWKLLISPRPSECATAAAPILITSAKLISESKSSAKATVSPGKAAKVGKSSFSVSWSGPQAWCQLVAANDLQVKLA